ncbi:MAG: toll/interleukin-1 receptor domain-containing protein [Candidatus Competibacteraceae bacterium]
MIIVLCEKSDKDIANAIAQDIAKEYSRLEIYIRLAEEGNKWDRKHAWDDLLIVLYNRTEYSESGKALIHQYIRETDEKGFILPVARYKENKNPPEPISGIKAMIYDATEPDEALKKITRRVGAMMGLRLRNYDSKIFISYRATDGSRVAQQVSDFLRLYGFQTCLDEARDPDGENKIQAGKSVQAEIEKNLTQANLVLLIDTPDAPNSKWIQKEIEIALSEGIPIYPLYIRLAGDHRCKPRFNALANLSRWWQIDTDLTTPLSQNILDSLLKEIEYYLQEIYRRKLKVPYIVKQELEQYGFDWNPVVGEKNLYEAIKQKRDLRNLEIKWRILSQCSIFDEIYEPDLIAFADFIRREGCGHKANFKFFIYDGKILSVPEIETMVNPNNDFLIMIHNQELRSFLSFLPSHFGRLLP